MASILPDGANAVIDGASFVMRSLLGGGAYTNPFPPLDNETANCATMSIYGCLDDFTCDPAYGLANARYEYCFTENTGGVLLVVPAEQAAWLQSHGTDTERIIATACQWTAFTLAIILLLFYGWSALKATCGWEEVYVCCVEVLFVTLEIFHEFDSPAMVYLSTGNQCYFLRYAEWLLSCPVILIHLSNLSGMKNDYSKRTMTLLVSCVGMIVFGMAAGLAVGWLKWFLYVISCIYSAPLYLSAIKCYIEAYAQVPKGICRIIIKVMAWSFIMSWGAYPILWLLGPEGFMKISGYTNTILHTICDIVAKEWWTFLGHHLRIKIHEHILIHGDIRKKTTIQVAGEDVEVEEYVEEEDEDTYKAPIENLANRNSFIVMRDRLKARGIETRASMDFLGTAGIHHTGPELESGRVILAVTDIFMVDVISAEFNKLPVPIELVPALGSENVISIVQQAMSMGGCDFVLVHPEFLKDSTPAGLVPRLRALRQKVVAFGPLAMEVTIMKAGVDAWVQGPPIDQNQLVQVISSIQTAAKQAEMYPPAMSMGPGMGMSMGMGMGMGMASVHNSALIPTMSAAQRAPTQYMSNPSMGAMGANPLYSNASPLGTTGSMVAASQPQDPAGGDMAMMNNLMNEINRLKRELGES